MLTIAFSTKKEGQELNDFLLHIDETIGLPKYLYEVKPYKNDGSLSLTKIYNQALSESKFDFVCLIHDDIFFLKKGWGAEALRILGNNDEYGIVGVAGSKVFESHAIWWDYQYRAGQVVHNINGACHISEYSGLIPDDVEECVVLDGLFLMVNKKKIKHNFDENIEGFHFYDIDICLSNYVSKACKIGVTTKIKIAHGCKEELPLEFFINREIINTKYNDFYPIACVQINQEKQKNG